MTAQPAWATNAWHNDPYRGFVDGVRLMLSAAEGLPMLGWELSCRITPGAVNCQRLLLGLPTAGVAPARLYGLVDALSMPKEFAELFGHELPKARQILLAVEAQPQDLEVRAYQVFNGAELSVAMRGYKWMSQQASRCRITDYHREGHSWPQVIAYYVQQSHQCRDSQRPGLGLGYSTAATIAQLAQDRRPQHDADFLRVSELAGHRASSCLRLYESGLQFRDIVIPVTTLIENWGLKSERASILSMMTSRPLGWIATGEDGSQAPFFTLYAQASLLDVRRLLARGVGS